MPTIERWYMCSLPVIVYCVSVWRWTLKYEEKCQSLEIKLSVVSGGGFLHSNSNFSSGATNYDLSSRQASPKLFKPLGNHWQGSCLRLLLTHRPSYHPEFLVTRAMQMWERETTAGRSLLHKISVVRGNYPDAIRTCWESFSVIPHSSAPDFELLSRMQVLLLISPLSHMSDAMVGGAHLPSSPPHLKDSLGCLERLQSSLKADRCKRGQAAPGESQPSLIGADWWLHLNRSAICWSTFTP